MKSPFASRKFLMAVAGGLVIVLNAILEAQGLPAVEGDTVLAFVGLLASYIFAQGAVDYARVKPPAPMEMATFATPLQPYSPAGQPLTADQLRQVDAHLAQQVARSMSHSFGTLQQSATCKTGAAPSEQ